MVLFIKTFFNLKDKIEWGKVINDNAYTQLLTVKVILKLYMTFFWSTFAAQATFLGLRIEVSLSDLATMLY